jgi:regulator of protease activity HflC (stomatin/prohibitin superfamily)
VQGSVEAFSDELYIVVWGKIALFLIFFLFLGFSIRKPQNRGNLPIFEKRQKLFLKWVFLTDF